MRSTLQQLTELAQKLAALAKAAGDALPKDPPPMAVDDKAGKANFVTEYDRKTQEFLETGCHALVPDAVFVGEESFETGGELPKVSKVLSSIPSTAPPISSAATAAVRCPSGIWRTASRWWAWCITRGRASASPPSKAAVHF